MSCSGEGIRSCFKGFHAFVPFFQTWIYRNEKISNNCCFFSPERSLEILLQKCSTFLFGRVMIVVLLRELVLTVSTSILLLIRSVSLLFQTHYWLPRVE